MARTIRKFARHGAQALDIAIVALIFIGLS